STAYAEGGPWLDDIRSYLRRNRDRLIELVDQLLPRAQLTTMEGTYIAWLDLRDYAVEGSMRAFLRDHAGVECTDGTECGTAWGGLIRFVYATPRPLMTDAITRIARALDDATRCAHAARGGAAPGVRSAGASAPGRTRAGAAAHPSTAGSTSGFSSIQDSTASASWPSSKSLTRTFSKDS